MSFVGPPFEHDVFFSYAHADVDRIGDAEIKAWCQKFASDLRQALRRFPEFAPLSLYLDESPRSAERLDETAELAPAVRKAAGSSALLCAMMSPWYLKSQWCAKEREWWDEGTRALAPTITSGFDRTFICRLMDTSEDQWPEIFKDGEGIPKKGFWLYDRTKPKDKRVPWGWIGTEEDRAAYKQCVIQVSGYIGSRLEEIRARLEADRKDREAVAKLQQAAGQVLYLYTRPDLNDPFDDAFERLQGAGYAVVPTAPTPLLRDGRLDDDQADELRSSDAILVVGTDDPRIDKDILAISRNSRRLAEALAIEPLPCLVFDLIGKARHPARRLNNARNLGIAWIDGTAPDWPADLRSCLHARNLGIAWIDGTAPDWPTDLRSCLHEAAPAPVEIGKRNQSAFEEVKRIKDYVSNTDSIMYDVFLSYAREDQRKACALTEELQKQGYHVFLDTETPPGTTWRNHIFSALMNSKCIIVAWSNYSIDSRWVLEEAEIGREEKILIPVLFNDVKPPFGFRYIQSADLIQWEPGQESQSFMRLVDGIARLLAPAET